MPLRAHKARGRRLKICTDLYQLGSQNWKKRTNVPIPKARRNLQLTSCCKWKLSFLHRCLTGNMLLLREGCVPSSWPPKENELNSIFRGSLFHVLCLRFFFFNYFCSFFYPMGPFEYIIAFGFVSLLEFQRMPMNVSLHVYLGVFVLFLVVFFFLFVCFILFQFLFCLIKLYFILLSSLRCLLFSTEKQKGVYKDERGGRSS